MSYRRLLLLRWSRRDRLAIVIVAVTVAFLTGTVVMINAAETQTTEIASEFESPGTVVFRSGGNGDADRELSLPVAQVRRVNGSATYLVDRPRNASPIQDRGRRLWSGQAGVTRGDIGEPSRHRVRGEAATLTLNVSPRPGGRTMLPPSWYVAEPGTADRLGRTGTFVITTDNETLVPADGVPLLGALAFFVAGTRELLQALTAATVGGGLLVGVTVFSVTRMSVRDRRPVIRVIRSTGGRRRTVLALFAGRAGLLTGIGAAGGYAVGVILVNVAVNAAVFIGLPTSLSTTVTPRIATQLLPVFGALVGIGAVAGGLAALAVVRSPPGRIGKENATGRTRRSSRLRPQVLGWRVLPPTVATLMAFMLFASLIVGTAGAALPVTQAETAVITEPETPHPIASEVPSAYAAGLRTDGIAASPEILLLAVHSGQPYLARGANYTAFAELSDATLLSGRAPRSETEVVIGTGLARTLGVGVGESLVVGGSTAPAVTRVRVVGRFDAPGPFDDQLIVPLQTARHLANVAPDRVHFIRAERLPAGGNANRSDVVGLRVPAEVRTGEPIPIRVTVRNAGLTERRRTVRIELNGVVRTRTVRLEPNSRQTVTVRIPAPEPGRYTVDVGSQTAPVRVLAAHSIRIDGLPRTAPPGSYPQLRVVNASGVGVGNATVTLADRTYRTGPDGRVRVRVPATGTYDVRATTPRATVTATLVVRNVTRRLEIGYRLQPQQPSQLTRPVLQLTIDNPWNRTISRTIEVTVDDRQVRQQVEVAPGGRVDRTIELPRQRPGRYVVRVESDGRPLVNASYRVTGDRRLAAALATAGRARTSGIGAAIETAFGNLQLLLAVLAGLAGVMSIGGTTAVFAQAVQARRRTMGIHRVVGAPRLAVLRLVLTDAAVLGVAGTLIAGVLTLGTLWVFRNLGYLTVFGVRLDVVPSPTQASVIGLAAVGLTLLGAGTATMALLRIPPGRLLHRREGPETAGPDTEGTRRE